MRKDRRAIIVGIAGQEFRVDATAAIEQPQVEIDRFVISHGCADDAGAQGWAASNRKRGGLRRRRKSAIVSDVVPEARCNRRAPCYQGGQTGERIRRRRRGCVRVGDSRMAKLRERGTFMGIYVVREIESM